MPQLSAVAARGARTADHHASDAGTVARVTQIAMLLATRGLPLARLALNRARAGRETRSEADVFDSEADDAPESALARTTTTLARAVNAVGTTIYDYSNGQYGIKPVDPKDLRRARKAAEKKVRAEGKDDAPVSKSPKRGRWALLGLGALVVAGGVAVVILQREQIRAATNQLLDQGRQTVRQLQARSAADA